MNKNPNDRVVIDTNVLLSACISPKGAAFEALRQSFVKYDLTFTKQTYGELTEKFDNQKLKPLILSERKEALQNLLEERGKFFSPTFSLNLCRDPKDDKFISLAEQEKAKYLITGDKDLLSIKPELVSTKIITPRDFLEHEKHLSRAESYGLTSEKAEEFARRMQQFEARQPKTLVQELNKNRNQDIER